VLRSWRPGDLAIVCGNSLISRLNSNVAQWTFGHKLVIIVGGVNRWVSSSDDEDVVQCYIVMVSHTDYGAHAPGGNLNPITWPHVVPLVSGLYSVPSDRLLDLTEFSEPGRLFGTQRLRD